MNFDVFLRKTAFYQLVFLHLPKKHYGGFFVNVDIPVQKMKYYLDTTNEIYEKVAMQFVKKLTN